MRRRNFLRYAGLLAVGSQLPQIVEGQPDESTWPMFQFDAANTGYNPNASIDAEQVGQQWRTSTLGEVVASPIVADGTVYVGSKDGNIYAMNLADGNKQWEYNIGEPIEATPAIHNGSIYVGSTGGKVYSLSTNGRKNWEVQIGNSKNSEILSSVITDGEYLYVLSGEWDDFDGWAEGRVHSIRPSDGEKIWGYSLISSFPHTPAIDSGTLYTFGIGTEDNANGSVLAINTTNGTVEWSGGESMGIGGITVDGNSVYVTPGANTYALDASSGSIQWENNYSELEDSWVYSSVSIEGRNVYVGVTSGNDFGFVYGLDAVTGERTSRVRLPDEIRSSPIISEDFIYIGTEGGTVHSINRTDFEEAWSFSTGKPVRSTPALVDKSLYVGSNDGYIYSLGRVTDTNQTPTEDRTVTPTESSKPQSTPTRSSPQTPTATPVENTSPPTATPIENTSPPTATPVENTSPTPATTEYDFQRGFFTNGGGSSFSFLNNPLVLTVGGFFLSVFGIVYQLVEGD